MRLLVKYCLAALLAFGATTFGTAQTLVEKADKQYELHAYRLASQSYESLLSRGEDEWGATSRLADCYVHLNEPAKAAEHYARLVGDGKAKEEDFLQFGRTLMMLGRYDEASAQFTIYQKTNLVAGTHFLKACKFAIENDNANSDFKIQPLAKVNTAAADFGAVILKDQLIWSSSRMDRTREKNNNGARTELSGGVSNQLFAAPIEGISNAPFKVRFLKSDFKNIFNESQPSFSADGKKVAFMRNNFAEDERFMSAAGLEMSVYTATVDDDGNWNDIKAFPFNNGATGFPALSADGLTLYVAAIRAGGQGGFDLYSSTKRGNTWGEPRNLGATINTPGDEITPFAEGKALYFSSDWHIGFGGFDVFKTEGVVGEVVNMGIGVNSSNDDIGFVFAPSVATGFLTSNRNGGSGKYDIYRLSSTGESVNVVIVDESKRPIEKAQVTVTSGNAANFIAQRGGNYIANLSDKKPLTITIKKEGFKTMTQVFEPQFAAGQRVMEVEMARNIPTSMSTVAVKPTPEYAGLVIDGATGEPLEGVVVRLTNQATNTQTEKTTDGRGRFRFQMAGDAQLMLTFSSEKFVVATKMVKASEQTSKYIGEIALKPSDVTDKFAMAEDKKKPVKVGSADAPAGTGYGIQAMPNKIKHTPPVSDDDKTVQTKGEPAFAVQVGVSTSKEVLNLTKFSNLKKIGNVYVVPEDGKQKIRLGVYHTRAEADSAVKSAVALNYEGVFVTQEKNAAAVAENMLKAVPKSIPQKLTPKAVPDQYATVAVRSKAVDPPAPKVETPVKPKVEDKAFKVKIAAMKKPSLFNDEKVATLWKVEQLKEGEWTVFVMDGFKTLEQAKEMKKKVQASGYKDAKVVVRDGEKLRVVD
jgi:Carboxypeptidase regulatory-like domain/WD40-like Beta Propeller Repeat